MSDTREGRLRILIVGWLVLVAVAYGTAASVMVGSLEASKEEAAVRHAARLNTGNAEPDRTKAETRRLEGATEVRKVQVETGLYIDRIPHLSTRDISWSVDFYIWFRWKDGNIDPGKTFKIVDGQITRKNLEAEYEDVDGHYALYRVEAEITKFFNITRYPRDDHLMTIRIEDAAHQSHQLRYVPDVAGSDLSSRVKIPEYAIHRTALVEKKHSYKTRRGDPRLPENYKATYSQLIYGIGIMRPGWALYVKMFLGIFASVGICLLAFLINPSHNSPRFGVGVGAFFASIAATYVISRQIPQTSIIGLTDFVTGTSLVTIFLTLLTSAMSLGIHHQMKLPGVSRNFDLAALAVFLVGYAALNVVIANAASL